MNKINNKKSKKSKRSKRSKRSYRSKSKRSKRSYRSKRSKSKRSKRSYYFNSKNSKKSFDVYIDKNPKDTISIKYNTLQDVKNTIKKLEKLFKSKKYTHKRIWQVGMIMYVRLRVLKKQKPKQYKLSKKYFQFLGKRTKKKTFEERKNLKFVIKI
jgi:hypothetical protein